MFAALTMESVRKMDILILILSVCGRFGLALLGNTSAKQEMSLPDESVRGCTDVALVDLALFGACGVESPRMRLVTCFSGERKGPSVVLVSDKTADGEMTQLIAGAFGAVGLANIIKKVPIMLKISPTLSLSVWSPWRLRG